MLRVAVALAAVVGIGFLAFPQFRPMIVAVAPFALLALCPISMLAMMLWSKSEGTQNTDTK